MNCLLQLGGKRLHLKFTVTCQSQSHWAWRKQTIWRYQVVWWIANCQYSQSLVLEFNAVLCLSRHLSWLTGRQWHWTLVLSSPGDSGSAGLQTGWLPVLHGKQLMTEVLAVNSVWLHTHTHPFNGPFPGLPRWASSRKVKPIWILRKQETVSGSGISWAICKSAPRSRQITTPAPHLSVFLQAGCPSCRPTNSVKALKGKNSG